MSMPKLRQSPLGWDSTHTRAAPNPFGWCPNQHAAAPQSPTGRASIADRAVSGVEGLAALGICVVLRRLTTVVFPVVTYDPHSPEPCLVTRRRRGRVGPRFSGILPGYEENQVTRPAARRSSSFRYATREDAGFFAGRSGRKPGRKASRTTRGSPSALRRKTLLPLKASEGLLDGCGQRVVNGIEDEDSEQLSFARMRAEMARRRNQKHRMKRPRYTRARNLDDLCP
jgi:hypothetical protein